MNRRMFLTQTAALPVIFGLRRLLAQDSAPAAPDWHRAALRRMKETGRNGVVLVIPDPERDELVSEKVDGAQGVRIRRVTEEAARRRLGTTLWALAHEDFPAAHLLFTECVFVCLSSEEADRLVRRPGDARNRFLLDPDGRVLDAGRVDGAVLDDPEKFVASFAAFARGAGNERIRERAEAIGRTLGEDVRKAVAQLGADAAEDRMAAQTFLLGKADGLAPYLAHQAIVAPDVETRGRMGDILVKHYASVRESAPGPKLPFGTELPEFADGCGGLRLKGEEAAECGLGRAPARSRRFILFLQR